jgi:hypothetical protein
MDEYDEIVVGGILTQHAQGKLSAAETKKALREVGYTADLRNFKHGEQAVLKIGSDTYDFIEYNLGGEVKGNMSNSVVRNATKEDIPIFDSSTDFGDQYLMDKQNLDTKYDEIVRMLEEDPYALDPLDQDTTTAPEEFDEPMEEIGKKLFQFDGSESEGGLADAPLGGIDLLNTNYVKPKYIPLEYGGSPGIESIMKKTTIEMQEIPADRKMLVMNRIMKQGGVTQSRDPRLMAQLAQVLGRDG